MNEIFKTFRPENSLISKYVSYYYLDIKPNNIKTEFECFPHFNTSISLYKSNLSSKKGEVIFENNVKPLQIFTPIRETTLRVQQIGKVHRIVIVFNPLGIQQFYKKINFTNFIKDINFFTNSELSKLFASQNTTIIANQLDQCLLDKLIEYRNSTLNKALLLILGNLDSSSIEKIAAELKISRRHLNRLFNSHFGISVKKFNKIVLFRKTLKQKLFENAEQSFTALAYEFNYCDQSHLNKTFQNFTSNAPRTFFKKGTLLGNEDTFWHIKNNR